jgi:hypothetical protein
MEWSWHSRIRFSVLRIAQRTDDSSSWYVNRFPVPQDDSFQSQPRQSALWAVQSRNASLVGERDPEAFQASG